MRPSNTTENTYATETWYMISWNTGQCIRWRWFICDNNNISRLINRSGCRRVEARPFRGALSSLTLISPLLSSPPVMSQRWPRVCQNWYSGPSYHKPINHSECTFCIGAERRCWKFLTSKERLLTVSFFPMFVGVTQFVSLSNFALPSCVPAPRAGHRSRTFPSPSLCHQTILPQTTQCVSLLSSLPLRLTTPSAPLVVFLLVYFSEVPSCAITHRFPR